MATTTTTQSINGNGDVQTKLCYYSRTAGPMDPLDFTVPGTEAKSEEYQKLTEFIPLTIHNVRNKASESHSSISSTYTLGRNGFQYAIDPVDGLENATTEEQIKDILLPATEALVKRLTGAHKTLIFTHRIRSLAEDSNKRADNKAPAHSVHTDFTPAGAMNQLATVIRDPNELEELKKGRVMVINVWRPLKTIRKDPLAIANWQTVASERDIVANRMILSEHFWAELGKVKYNERHEWVYMEGQTPEEPVVFCQFDSGVEDGGMTVPHSAFVDEQYANQEARTSIEIKMFAFVKE